MCLNTDSFMLMPFGKVTSVQSSNHLIVKHVDQTRSSQMRASFTRSVSTQCQSPDEGILYGQVDLVVVWIYHTYCTEKELRTRPGRNTRSRVFTIKPLLISSLNHVVKR